MGFGPKPRPEGAEKRSVHAVHEHLRRPRTTDLGTKTIYEVVLSVVS